jgi:type II secretory pathway pseudopilin PulG
MRYAIQSPTGATRRLRAGISLLEVLIAVGVLSVALLGVAAVLPVATFGMIETAKADRAAACGTAVLHDAKVQGILNPHAWRQFNLADAPNYRLEAVGELDPNVTSAYVSQPRGFQYGESYAIDPYYMARNESPAANRFQFNDFPYNPASPGSWALYPSAANRPGWRWTRMQRVTWADPGLTVSLLSEEQAERVFVWDDDLVIPVPGPDGDRPRQMFLSDNLRGEAFPRLASTTTPLYAQNAGNYSYLITVTPSAEHVDFVNYRALSPNGDDLPYTHAEHAPKYDVSVIVFYKRDMNPPSLYDPAGGGFEPGQTPGERQLRLEFAASRFFPGGTALGGGDAEVMLLPGQQDSSGTPLLEYLEFKKNEWVMVSGGYATPYKDPVTGDYVPIGVHKWYRIVAVGEIVIEGDLDGNGRFDPDEDLNNNTVQDPPYRGVTLAGPDWNPLWSQDWSNPLDGIADLLATVPKGVVGVSTATVQYEW